MLEKVPGFDRELGPGGEGLGQCEDALFSMQIIAAGYRVIARLGAAVEHHFDPSRLSHDCFLAAAERRARSEAYVRHHWEHLDLGPAWKIWRSLLKRAARLRLERLRRREERRRSKAFPSGRWDW